MENNQRPDTGNRSPDQETLRPNELEFAHKRGNILILFEKLTQLPLLIGTILFSIYAGTKMDFQLVSAAAFIAISPLLQLVKFAFTYYTISEGQLIVESGIWNKKRVEIPLRSITTVDLTQNILYQIFKTYKIKVDNGSQSKNTVNAAEVQFALKADLAFQFKQLVESDSSPKEEIDSFPKKESESDGQVFTGTSGDPGAKRTEGTNAENRQGESSPGIMEKVNTNQYTKGSSASRLAGPMEPLPTIVSSPLDFLQLGLLESKLVYILSLIPVLSAAAYFIGSLGFAPGEEEIATVMENLFSVVPIGLALFLGIVILFVCGLVFSIFRAIMTFFGFQISADSAKIYIEYGLLTKRKYTLQKEKISGIVLRQNLLMRLFHQYQVEVLVIGYGDKSDEEVKQQPILFPIATKKKIEEIVEKIIPEFSGGYYTGEETGKPTSPRAFRYFFYQSGFVFSTIVLIGCVVFTFLSASFPIYIGLAGTAGTWMKGFIHFAPLATGILLEALTIGSILLQFSNTRMVSGSKIITIQSGGYHRTVTVLKTSSIESITAIASRWKIKRRFASIQLGYVAPLRISKIMVRNREIVEFETLEGFLEM